MGNTQPLPEAQVCKDRRRRKLILKQSDISYEPESQTASKRWRNLQTEDPPAEDDEESDNTHLRRHLTKFKANTLILTANSRLAIELFLLSHAYVLRCFIDQDWKLTNPGGVPIRISQHGLI